MFLLELVEKNARIYHNKTAFIFGDRRCNFLEFKERCYKVANGLISLGVKKGNKVGIVAENGFEWPEIYMGAGKAGAVVVPLNYRLIPRELSYLINHAEVSTLLVGQNVAQGIDPIKSELKMVKNYICFGNYDGMISYDDFLSAPATKPEVEVNENDLFLIAYTGGTTGRPKGVMLTYRNLYEQALGGWTIEAGRRHNDIAGPLTTPLFHVASYMPLFAAFIMGNTQVILRRVDEASILEAIQKERITFFCPFTFVVTKRLLKFPDLGKYDLSSLRVLYMGGAPITQAQIRPVMEAFPSCRIFQSYGQTEMASISAMCLNDLLEAGYEEKAASAGKELFNVQVRVVDGNCNDIETNQVGELIIKGPGVMQDYWRLPEETKSSLDAGWKYTGDLGKIDEEGFIWIADRKKDAIRSFGEYIYSQEVEDAISTHPSVQEVAVIGVPDEKWGEAVKALVLLKEGHKVTEKEIIDHCRIYLSGFKCPKSVAFYPSFPRTAMGKIDKVELRKQWR